MFITSERDRLAIHDIYKGNIKIVYEIQKKEYEQIKFIKWVPINILKYLNTINLLFSKDYNISINIYEQLNDY